MGVYIPNMEMPENCFKCPAHEWYDFGGENHGYQCPILRTTKAVSNCEARTKRRDNCPMIPVPPHGRCIDADAFISTIRPLCEEDKFKACTFETVKRLMLEHISSAPTIIEAEEGE